MAELWYLRATNQERLHEYANAEQGYQRALAIMKHVESLIPPGKSSAPGSLIEKYLFALAFLYDLQGNSSEASRYYAEGVEMARRNWAGEPKDSDIIRSHIWTKVWHLRLMDRIEEAERLEQRLEHPPR